MNTNQGGWVEERQVSSCLQNMGRRREERMRLWWKEDYCEAAETRGRGQFQWNSKAHHGEETGTSDTNYTVFLKFLCQRADTDDLLYVWGCRCVWQRSTCNCQKLEGSLSCVDPTCEPLSPLKSALLCLYQMLCFFYVTLKQIKKKVVFLVNISEYLLLDLTNLNVNCRKSTWRTLLISNMRSGEAKKVN